MRSKRETVHIPLDILPAFQDRAKKEGYPSVSAWLIGTGLYDVMIDKPHHATGGLHKFTIAEQDRIFKNAAAQYFAGNTLGGSWYEAKMEKVAKEAALKEKLPPSRVGRQILQMLADPEQPAEAQEKKPRKKKVEPTKADK